MSKKDQPHYSVLKFSFFIFVVTVSIGLYAPFFLSLAPLTLISKKAWHLQGRLSLFFANLYIQFSPLKLTSDQLEIPRNTNVLVVSNHRSHLDVFVYVTLFPNIRVATNRYLFRIPLFGTLLRIFRQIPFEKGNPDLFNKSMNTAKKAALNGDRVLFFPELTRCLHGDAMTGRFYLHPFALARETGTMILPMVIKNSDDVWPKYKLKMDFTTPVKVKTLPLINPAKFKSTKELCSFVQQTINQELVAHEA